MLLFIFNVLGPSQLCITYTSLYTSWGSIGIRYYYMCDLINTYYYYYIYIYIYVYIYINILLLSNLGFDIRVIID